MYSLPTHKYNNVGNNFRRYSSWLESRNKLIQGFTKSIDKYYMAWLLIESFTIVILDMDFALNVEYFDVVPCGAYVDINNYPIDGLAITNNSMSLLRRLNYNKTHPITPIWSGFHLTVLS